MLNSRAWAALTAALSEAISNAINALDPNIRFYYCIKCGTQEGSSTNASKAEAKQMLTQALKGIDDGERKT